MGQTARETWAQRIEAWKASGLGAKEFGAKIGIKPKSLEWWKWNLGAEAARSKRQPPSARSAQLAVTAVAPLTFVEMPTGLSKEPLEVVLANGVRIRVPIGFEVTTLLRLLDALERRS
jgi:hypothetical protein